MPRKQKSVAQKAREKQAANRARRSKEVQLEEKSDNGGEVSFLRSEPKSSDAEIESCTGSNVSELLPRLNESTMDVHLDVFRMPAATVTVNDDRACDILDVGYATCSKRNVSEQLGASECVLTEPSITGGIDFNQVRACGSRDAGYVSCNVINAWEQSPQNLESLEQPGSNSRVLFNVGSERLDPKCCNSTQENIDVTAAPASDKKAVRKAKQAEAFKTRYKSDSAFRQKVKERSKLNFSKKRKDIFSRNSINEKEKLRKQKKRTMDAKFKEKENDRRRKQMAKFRLDDQNRLADNARRATQLKKRRANDPKFRYSDNKRRIDLYRVYRQDDWNKKLDNIRRKWNLRKKRAENQRFRTAENQRRRLEIYERRKNEYFRAAENLRRKKQLKEQRANVPLLRVVENERRRLEIYEWRRNAWNRAADNLRRKWEHKEQRKNDSVFRMVENERRRIEMIEWRRNIWRRAADNIRRKMELREQRASDSVFRENENQRRKHEMAEWRRYLWRRAADNIRRKWDHKQQRKNNPQFRKWENDRRRIEMAEWRRYVWRRAADNIRRKWDHKQKRANDPDFRKKENERRRVQMAQWREYLCRRRADNERRKWDHQQKRATDPEFRKRENQRRKIRIAELRANNPWIRNEESFNRTIYFWNKKEKSGAETLARKLVRRCKQRIKRAGDRSRMSVIMRRIETREPELLRINSGLRLKRFDVAVINFESVISEGPTHVCACCGTLKYRKSISTLKVPDTNDPDELDFYDKVTEAKIDLTPKFCKTCASYIRKKKIPRVSLSNGLMFPEIPPELKNLSRLEERLVSLRIPFMQIRQLGYQRQWAIKGNVVNVENDIDTCARALPREFNETGVVQIKFKRRICNQHHFIYDKIYPDKVIKATQYLLTTPLYREANVRMSEEWQERYGRENAVDFIVENDNEEENLEEHDEEVDHETEIVGADETLLFRGETFNPAEVHIAPGEGKTPLPFHLDTDAEYLSFPTIYCGQKYNLKNEKGSRRLTYTDVIKSELQRYDRRCVKPEKILFSFARSYAEKIKNAFQICLRQKASSEFGQRLTAKCIRSPGALERIISKDNGYAVYKNVRSSPAYWKNQSKRVIAMVRQLGNCSFFITLSAAETKWIELLKILKKVLHNEEITDEDAENLSNEERAELIRSDPVTCSRHFDHRYQTLMRLILKDKGGLFEPYQLEDHFSRIEYQLRGSPHSHGLYWVKDAPIYNKDNPESATACIKFIDKYIWCTRDLEGLIMKKYIHLQIHKHSHTCRKGWSKDTCRFNFPKPPMSETLIMEPFPKDYDKDVLREAKQTFKLIQERLTEICKNDENISFEEFINANNLSKEKYLNAVRSSIKRSTVFLKRKPNEAYVNPYNPEILITWKANMDIQFVLDTYACAKYCVGYIMKSEGGVSKLLRAAAEDAKNGDKTIQEKLKNFAKILMKGSEISAQEAVAFLLGLPNTYSSRTDVFINTGKPLERVGILKPPDQLKELDDDSEDILQKGILDHYVQRSEKLEEVCLADYACFYQYHKKKITTEDQEEDNPEVEVREEDIHEEEDRNKKRKFMQLDGSGYVSQRGKRKIIRFRHFSKITEPEEYWREQIMLFIPWRDEEKDIGSGGHINKAGDRMSLILENSKPYYYSRELDDGILGNLIEEIEDEEQDGNMNVSNEMEVLEDERYMGDFLDNIPVRRGAVESVLPPRMAPNEEYYPIMRSLNKKQRQIVNHILYALKCRQTPFHIFLSGGAGVGKSHVITAIVQSYLRFRLHQPGGPEDIPIIISAPTGKAAFNVFGMTLHSTFKLPASQYGGILARLDDATANALRIKFGGTDVFIIDEISMVSSRTFDQIDKRLQQIFQSQEPFGGKSIVVCGHMRQLPPIGGKFVFQCPSDNPRCSLVARNPLWESFKIFELDEIMRQRGELEFCKALNNMSEGCMDTDDINLLKGREITPEKEPVEEAVWLFQTNRECEIFNANIHEKLNTEGALCIARDTVSGKGSAEEKMALLKEAETFSTQESDGVPYKTFLKVGGIYFVTSNVDVSDGLFNGATGILRFIEYKPLAKTGENVPDVAWMEFPNIMIGKNCRVNYRQRNGNRIDARIDQKWTPILRFRRSLSKARRFSGALELIREQIPLKAANGMTIAKSQGSSMPFVVVSTKPQSDETGDIDSRRRRQPRERKLTRENLYVACSRATSRNGLWLNGRFIAPDPPKSNDPVSAEMEILRNSPLQLNQIFLADVNVKRKIFYQNVNHFLTHEEDIKADINIMSSDLIFFSEPHLTSSSIVSFENYSLINFVKCGGSGKNTNSEGTLTLHRNGFEVISVRNFMEKSGRKHFIITRVEMPDVIIFCCYKHPEFSIPKFVDMLRKLLEEDKGKQVAVFGDFNVEFSKADQLIQLLDQYNCKFKLDQNSSSNNKGSLIDLCFSNMDSIDASLYESYYSDHKGICITF